MQRPRAPHTRSIPSSETRRSAIIVFEVTESHRRSGAGVGAAARAKANPVALRVKLADNADNQDMTRIGNVTEKDLARLEEYKRVRAFLLGP